MRTYTMKTTHWGDGYSTIDIFNKLGDWDTNVGVFSTTRPEFREQAAEKLAAADFENIEWVDGEPVAATRDENKRDRDLMARMGIPDDNLPAPDENTDWQLEKEREVDNESTATPTRQQVLMSRAQVELERRINEALPADRQLWFERLDGLIPGWGSMPVQINGLIGPDARNAPVSGPGARLFYFRLRGNTARLEVFHDRNIPRDRIDRLGETAEVATVHPVVEDDDHLGSLPSDEETVELFSTLVKELAAPDPMRNPTGAQSLSRTMFLMDLSQAFRDGGLEAADALARERLNGKLEAPHAQRWLELTEEEKRSAFSR